MQNITERYKIPISIQMGFPSPLTAKYTYHNACKNKINHKSIKLLSRMNLPNLNKLTLCTVHKT